MHVLRERERERERESDYSLDDRSAKKRIDDSHKKRNKRNMKVYRTACDEASQLRKIDRE